MATIAGRLDVDQLMNEIPANLYTEWIAYHILEPPSGTRICRYLAQLTSYVVSLLTGKVTDMTIHFGSEFMITDEEDHAKEVDMKMKHSLALMQKRFPNAIKKVEG